MADFKIVMPKLGESIQEGTITKWFVKVGDTVEEDDILFEVATDKVDSEIPSPVDGKITQILFPENSLVPVGEVLAIINIGGEQSTEIPAVKNTDSSADSGKDKIDGSLENVTEIENVRNLSNRFYSPLVKTIAREEKISLEELEQITGSGAGGRVQKKDLLEFIENRNPVAKPMVAVPEKTQPERKPQPVPVSIGANDQIIEMDRVRKLIADHMVMSKQVSPHVTSVVEADVTELVLWRNKNKEIFEKK